MNEWLDGGFRKARKEHECCFCGGTISKGEEYKWDKTIFDGTIYEWHCHKRCDYIAKELWDYADPDEGMDSGLFFETLWDFCTEFICPECPNWNDEFDCAQDEYCINRAYEYLQTHELYKAKTDSIGRTYWKCRERETNEQNT